mgnify:CR=1 FL=1
MYNVSYIINLSPGPNVSPQLFTERDLNHYKFNDLSAIDKFYRVRNPLLICRAKYPIKGHEKINPSIDLSCTIYYLFF